MTTMLEKAARALADLDIRQKRRWDTSEAELERLLPGAIDYNWRDCIPEALAVLQAIRTPDEAMIEAGWETDRGSKCEQDMEPQLVWTAMIDSVIGEQG